MGDVCRMKVQRTRTPRTKHDYGPPEGMILAGKLEEAVDAFVSTRLLEVMK